MLFNPSPVLSLKRKLEIQALTNFIQSIYRCKMTNFKRYRILYNFNHSRMGFQNSITVEALNVDLAIQDVKRQVSEVYGNKMLQRFSFKPDPVYTGVVIR